ncbi:MAG TPA: hypothetical protein VF177_07520 [Anaerolineae bacterium]
MNKSVKQILFWTPRVLSVLFAIFISLFAFDVFDEGYTFWQTILALLIHLIPTGIILLGLALSWRWEWIGAILFTGLSVFYLVAAQGQHWSAYLLISGPLFLIGALFLLNWLYRAELHPRPGV